MSLKQCYILDASRGYVFYGELNEALVGMTGYTFYEVPEAIKDRPLKIENGIVVVDFQKEYNDKITYQKLAFKEFRRAILEQIAYANAVGNTALSTELVTELNAEKSAYEARVNAIVKETN